MDPLANVKEQRELANKLVEHSGDLDLDYMTDVERLAELVLALDEWRQRGGYDPYTNQGV
jgi:hypothetical protein